MTEYRIRTNQKIIEEIEAAEAVSDAAILYALILFQSGSFSEQESLDQAVKIEQTHLQQPTSKAAKVFIENFSSKYP